MPKKTKRLVVGADLHVENCPPQRGPLRSKARFVCMVAGTRGGKTRTASRKFFGRILKDLESGKGQEPSGVGKDRRARLHYWVVAPTSDLLKEPKRYLFETIPPEFFEDPHRPINHENQMWLKRDVLIEFRSADRPLSLVSVGLNGMWIDEAARVKAEAWVGNLYGRLTDKRDAWALFSSTPLGQNWLYTEIFRKGVKDDPDYDGEYASFQWHTADNLTIARERIEKAKKNLPRRYYLREYEADFSAFLGNIFDEFDEKIHVISEAQLRYDYGWGVRPLRELFRDVVAGVDWGWTSPGAIVVIGDTGRERIVLEESYAATRLVLDPRMEANTWVGEAKRLRQKWGVRVFKADPALPGNIFDFSRSGVPVEAAYNDVLYGIRRVAEQLHPVEGRPRMRVLDTCKNFIREARSYVWDQMRGSDSFKEMPAPNQSDHALDAGRYATVELVKFDSTEEPTNQRTRYGTRPIG